ncbi:MAG: Cys-tRNA(Pro) deacylase, partial [Peptostreptococcaceae bacterium]
MSKSKLKTNAMRILDINNVNYSVHCYDVKKEHIDGVEVASKIGKDVSEVYKTLISIGASKNYYVYVIPV